MFYLRSALAVCILLTCVCLALTYEDDIQVNFNDMYFNEITEGDAPEPTPSTAPCSSQDLTKWDKMFSMLENSQMRENMLLQYADDIVKVEMGSLRGEILRFMARYSGSCGAAMETVGRRMTMQLDAHLKEYLERLILDQKSVTVGNSVENSNRLEATLQQLLSTARTQASRLAKLETSCFSNPEVSIGLNPKTAFQLQQSGGAGNWEQEVTSQEVALEAAVSALKQTRLQLEKVLRSSRQARLPAGCEMSLLFPMRSSHIYTSVIPEVPLSLSAFTICLWVKPNTVSNKTVLFSYGNRRNPYEIQLLLAQTSALLSVGGEEHFIEARGVVTAGGASEWINLCGMWSSEQGLASLWAGGKKVASSPGVVEGHVLSEGGSLQLGQERNGCCPLSPSSSSSSRMPGFERGFDPKLAFTGKMTGVNIWDRMLSEEMISQQALHEGQGCEQRGNVVAWGVTEMVPHGGAQFIAN